MKRSSHFFLYVFFALNIYITFLWGSQVSEDDLIGDRQITHVSLGFSDPSISGVVRLYLPGPNYIEEDFEHKRRGADELHLIKLKKPIKLFSKKAPYFRGTPTSFLEPDDFIYVMGRNGRCKGSVQAYYLPDAGFGPWEKIFKVELWSSRSKELLGNVLQLLICYQEGQFTCQGKLIEMDV